MAQENNDSARYVVEVTENDLILHDYEKDIHESVLDMLKEALGSDVVIKR